MDGYVNKAANKKLKAVLNNPQWDDWLFKDTDRRAKLLQRNDKFRDQVIRIRNKYGIDPRAHKSKILDHQKLVSTWLASLNGTKKEEWDGYVTYLMYNSRLMPGWRIAVQAYILTDIFLAPPAILIHDTPDEHMFMNMQLMINDEISKADLDKLYKYFDNWLLLNKYRSKIKRMPYENMPFYFIMYDLRAIGLGNGNIAATLGANFEGQADTPPFTTRFVRDSLNNLDKLINAQVS